MDTDCDILIIGAGSAGAVLAARLSEDAQRRVILLDAGRDWRADEAPPEMQSANPLAIILPEHLQAEWQFPQLMARRTRAQQPKLYWRGRGIGGSSAVNGQIAIRGVADAFDEWAEAGCEGWSFESVLPHFLRIEADPDAPPSRFHGTHGPVPVYRAPRDTWGPVDRGLCDAALALGYGWNDDLNAPDGEGASCYPINSRDLRRVSTNEAYLEPARSRPNLIVHGEALVDRLLFRDGAAVGARVRRGGDWQDITAREVVLAAGAVHSPAILWRSGIGPAEELRALGIAPLRDAPAVGRNFIEHPLVRATVTLKPELRPRDPDARHTNCCVTYSSRLAGGGRRDMMFIGFNHRGFDTAGDAAPGGISIGVFNAFSRGELRLLSADPTQDPLIEANMLDDARDRERLRDGVRRLAALTADPALAGIAERFEFGLTGQTPTAIAALPDDALDAVLLAEAADAQHASGTCRMSAYEDPRGVVDPDGRVKGVRGLRVADASIMPFDCRANTHFTTMMIGEAIAARFRAEG